jgi:plastocyanin
MKARGVVSAAFALVLAAILVGCAGSTTPTTGTSGVNANGSTSAGATVVEKGIAFDPPTIEVKVGETVTFKNEDMAAHNVSIDGKKLGTQEPGASVKWTAPEAGTFPYTCAIHPSMTGEITVK